MNTSDFILYFEHSPLKKYFAGVYPSDKIPKFLKVHNFFICNTDDSGNPGRHWYLIYKVNKAILECFDSLGIDDDKRKFLFSTFKSRGIRKLKYNMTKLQSQNTSTCGQFCVYYIVNRIHNLDLSFSEFLNEYFEIDEDKNEQLVNRFWEEENNFNTT